MNGTRIYQGWRYTFDQARPGAERWQATRSADILFAQSEAGIKKAIDKSNDEESQLRHREQFMSQSLAYLAVMG